MINKYEIVRARKKQLTSLGIDGHFNDRASGSVAIWPLLQKSLARSGLAGYGCHAR
jgi:hypothetical protein